MAANVTAAPPTGAGSALYNVIEQSLKPAIKKLKELLSARKHADLKKNLQTLQGNYDYSDAVDIVD